MFRHAQICTAFMSKLRDLQFYSLESRAYNKVCEACQHTVRHSTNKNDFNAPGSKNPCRGCLPSREIQSNCRRAFSFPGKTNTTRVPQEFGIVSKLYVYIYIHKYTHTHTHTYIRTYLRTYIHTCIDTHTCIDGSTLLQGGAVPVPGAGSARRLHLCLCTEKSTYSSS